MTAPSHTITAATTDHMALTRDNLPRTKVIHISTNIHNLANKLMANHHRHRNRRLRPAIPIVDMHIRATDSRAVYLNKHIINTYLWFWYIL
jgi:hypothetical protein